VNPDTPPQDRRSSPLVSVLMSTCNGETYLVEQLDSILSQSCSNLELLVMDDASTDATPAILVEYAARDPRVVVSRSEKNRGLVPNLESLMQRARGEYLAVADQDDIWRPEKIETLLALIGHRSAIYSASNLIDGDGRDLGATLLQAIGKEPVSGSDPLQLFWDNTVSGHSLLVSKSLVSALIPFDAHLMYDHQIGIRALAANGLAYCDAPLVHHRIHSGNQVNRLLRPRPITGRDASAVLIATHARRIVRRGRFRRVLIERARFFHAGALLPSISENDFDLLERSARGYSQSTFDLSLFMFMMRHPELFNGRWTALIRAVKYAKGKKWLKAVCRVRRAFGG
jgi:glycosyltransferase involved in cell wall biosynthesis